MCTVPEVRSNRPPELAGVRARDPAISFSNKTSYIQEGTLANVYPPPKPGRQASPLMHPDFERHARTRANSEKHSSLMFCFPLILLPTEFLRCTAVQVGS